MSKEMADTQLIRIQRADSAWVYHVLEAQEGIVSYSTVQQEGEGVILSPSGLATCDLELTIPIAFRKEVRLVLEHLAASGVWIQHCRRERADESDPKKS